MKISIGTVIELGWADAYRKPVILVMEKEDNPHDHPMVREIAGYYVNTLTAGLELTIALLKGSPNGMVYLAGPITGLTYDTATDWREMARGFLETYNITGISPMRAKEYLGAEKRIEGSYEDTALSSAKGITTRDRWDVSRSDVMLVNLLDTDKRTRQCPTEDTNLCYSQDGPCGCGLDEGHGGRCFCWNCGETIEVLERRDWSKCEA